MQNQTDILSSLFQANFIHHVRFTNIEVNTNKSISVVTNGLGMFYSSGGLPEYNIIILIDRSFIKNSIYFTYFQQIHQFLVIFNNVCSVVFKGTMLNGKLYSKFKTLLHSEENITIFISCLLLTPHIFRLDRPLVQCYRLYHEILRFSS